MLTEEEFGEAIDQRMSELGVKKYTLEEFDGSKTDDSLYHSHFRMWCVDEEEQERNYFANEIENGILKGYYGEEVIKRVMGFYFDRVEVNQTGNFTVLFYLIFRHPN